MQSQDLLQYCKYYKGESRNPFQDKTLALIWEAENYWAHAGETNNVETLTNYLQEYFQAGLAEVGINDDTPITLKALLYIRYRQQQGLTPAEVKEAFSSFYNKHYPS